MSIKVFAASFSIGWVAFLSRSLWAVLALLLLPLPTVFPTALLAREARPIPITTAALQSFKIRSSQTAFGPLTFLGGFELTSPIADMGGLSAIVSTNHGATLLLVTDNALWLRLELDQKRDGTPLGISHALMAPLLGANGEALIGSAREDAESATFLGNDGLLVSFERHHRLLLYPLTTDLLKSRAASIASFGERPTVIALPTNFAARYNGGLETTSALGAGPQDILLLTERPLPKGSSSALGWTMTPSQPGSAIRFRYALSDGFEPTDAALLPDGMIMVLERRFSLFRGLSMRLRTFDPAAIKTDALIIADTLFQASMDHHVDNMEGLDVSRAGDGSTLITVISDDNRSVFQRSLLLRFRYQTD